MIPPEVANQVIESATAALEDVEKAKAEADEVKIDPVPGLGTAAEVSCLEGSLLDCSL